MAWIDPGAPTFFCNDMILDVAAPGIVRVQMICREGEDTIVCCNLVLPEAVVAKNMRTAARFMREADLVVPH